MPRMHATVVLVSFVAAALIPARAFAACDGTPGATGAITIDVASVSRTFVVRVPSGADGRTMRPVVFAFHPFGMNAQYMQSRVPSRVWPDAIMVYPDAFAGGGRAWQNRAGEAGDRDLAFFDAMLGWLRTEHCIDTSRVFVLGYSNGAGLANLLACERAGAVAGAALAAGRLTCDPSHALPIITSHGLRDSTVPYEQAIRAARAWSSVNRCSAPPRAGTPGCFAAPSCGVPLTMCTHTGGHEYSGTFSRSAGEFFEGLAK